MDTHPTVQQVKQVAQSMDVEAIRKLAQAAIDQTLVAQRSMDSGEYNSNPYDFMQARFELKAAREKLEQLIATMPVS